MAPNKAVVVAALACRGIALLLAVFAAASIGISGDFGFSTYSFLRMILPMQVIINILCLVYDVALVFYHVTPPRPGAMATLAAADWVMLHLLFAAALSSLAVKDLLEHDIAHCRKLPPGACGWFKASGVLTFFAWLTSIPVTIFTTAPAAAHTEG